MSGNFIVNDNMRTKEIHEFKKGQKVHLDDIYEIQGLAEGKWWKAVDPFDALDESEDEVTITEDIKITIIVERD